jgi:hypothetical protein
MDNNPGERQEGGEHMSLFEDTNPRELKELLGQIHSREAALPDFQRNFVWDPNATQELVISIASNYPAGSLLRIRNTHNLFANREIQGAPHLDGHHPTYLVLDGQQRLTSLYQAFYGVGEHRYFLNLQRLLTGDDFEDCIFHLRTNVKRAKQLERFDTQANELVLPLNILRNGSGGFSKWSKAVIKVKKVTTPEEEIDALDERLDEVQETWVQAIDDYRFPVVTLSDSTSAEAVCAIFETLNRTGVKLSPFELLTARYWPKNVNLRQLWQHTLNKYPIIADFGVDPYYMLQAVSLAARPTPSAKRSDVLNLEAAQVHQWWERVSWGMGNGLELLRDDCGLIVPAWLPYNTILIPLAATLAKAGLPTGPQAGAVRQRLTRWYWCSVFGQAYESSPTSQMAKDVAELLGWLKGGEAPETVREFRFDPRTLRDTTPRQRAVYRGAISLILRGHPRDFYNGAPLTGDLIVEHNVDDHHIFPQGYLATLEPAVSARDRDCVLNRTLIDRKTNISIGKRPPSAYMADIRTALGGTFATLLESHLLPPSTDGPLLNDDFENSLQWRQDALWSEIRSVTGAVEAVDLVEEFEAEGISA